MNPDKLFDYLDGKLAPAEREQLEEKLMADEKLRREFNIAREIHRGGGVSREVIVPGRRRTRRRPRPARSPSRPCALVFANVIGGLAFITYQEQKAADISRGRRIGAAPGRPPRSAPRRKKRCRCPLLFQPKSSSPRRARNGKTWPTASSPPRVRSAAKRERDCRMKRWTDGAGRHPDRARRGIPPGVVTAAQSDVASDCRRDAIRA